MQFFKYQQVCIAAFALFVLSLSQVGAETKKTTMGQALACGIEALTEARQSAQPEALIVKYLQIDYLTARALQVQHIARWSVLTQSEQALYRNATNRYIAKHNKFENVELGTVVFNPKRGRTIGNSYELPGVFKDTDGTASTFALLLVVEGKRCIIIDARWNDAWLSRYISFPLALS